MGPTACRASPSLAQRSNDLIGALANQVRGDFRRQLIHPGGRPAGFCPQHAAPVRRADHGADLQLATESIGVYRQWHLATALQRGCNQPLGACAQHGIRVAQTRNQSGNRVVLLAALHPNGALGCGR